MLIAWIAGMCDGENYGRLLAYRLPKEMRVLVIQQVETKIDQDSCRGCIPTAKRQPPSPEATRPGGAFADLARRAGNAFDGYLQSLGERDFQAAGQLFWSA